MKSSIIEEIKKEILQARSDDFDALSKENNELKDRLNASYALIENLKVKSKDQGKEISELQESVYLSEVAHDKLEQYNRRNNLEIAGISDNIRDENLESEVIGILKDVGVSVTSRDIEACHRLPKSKSEHSKNLPKRTILRFVNRKNVETALRNKKALKEKRRGIYFNENLCQNYRQIWFKCRDLHRNKRLYSFYTYNGTVHYRKTENGKPIKIDHLTDLDHFDKLDSTSFADANDWGADWGADA